MKVRARFIKKGKLKFIGHLDLLRLFQRVIKGAQIPIAYSQGFNPHSLLYFAQPLSVGLTSSGEYIDIQLTKKVEIQWIQDQMNLILPEELKIESIWELSEDSPSVMSLIDAAEYEIMFEKSVVDNDFIEKITDFYDTEEILVTRTTKKKQRTINIKDFIYEVVAKETGEYFIVDVILATGSRKNLNADLFLQPFIQENQLNGVYSIHRKDLLSSQDGQLVPLWKLGG